MTMTKINMMHAMPEGMRNMETGKIWEYPIYIGFFELHSIGPDKLRTDISLEGKKYYLVFTEKKLGMVLKAKLSYRYVTYMLRELLSYKLRIPISEPFLEEDIEKILYRKTMF